jgi:hypothetical protein
MQRQRSAGRAMQPVPEKRGWYFYGSGPLNIQGKAGVEERPLSACFRSEFSTRFDAIGKTSHFAGSAAWSSSRLGATAYSQAESLRYAFKDACRGQENIVAAFRPIWSRNLFD